MRVIAGAEQPARLDRTVRPQRAGRVLEQLGFELLPAEPGALVFANDLIKKCRRQVATIFVAGAAGHDADRVTHQIADQFRGPRRRGYHGTRVGPQPHPKHQHVPGLGVAPGSELIAPCRVVLRTAQAFRLISRIGGGYRTMGPTAADARNVMVEGASGILAISPGPERPLYEPSKRRLTWPNGAVATTYSADEPERLRGPQHLSLIHI